jgi:hypothetical protein
MAVKYVKDFEFSSDRGFHKSAEPMKAKASYGDMPARAKPNAAAMGAKKMESAPGRAKYAGGGRTSYADMPYAARVAKSRAESDARTAELRKKQDTSFGGKPNDKVQAMRARLDAKIAANRQASDAKEAARRAAAIAARKAPSGPTRSLRPAPTMTIMPVPYTEEPMMSSKPEMVAKKGGKVEKMQAGGSLIKKAKAAIAANKAAKALAPPKSAPSMELPGKGTLFDRTKRILADRGPVKPSPQPIMPLPGKKEGGIFSTEYMASKGPKTRGTPRKGREMGRKDRMDRMALEKMRKAEKYAPGLSIDMPDRKAHGGMPKSRKMMYGGGKC